MSGQNSRRYWGSPQYGRILKISPHFGPAAGQRAAPQADGNPPRRALAWSPATGDAHGRQHPATAGPLSGHRALRGRPPGRWRRTSGLFRALRQSERYAGGVPARRPRRRLLARPATPVRSGPLLRHPVRPAGLRPLDAARGAGGQHHLGPGGRHRAPARARRTRALAGVRRLSGARPWRWPMPRPIPSG